MGLKPMRPHPFNPRQDPPSPLVLPWPPPCPQAAAPPCGSCWLWRLLSLSRSRPPSWCRVPPSAAGDWWRKARILRVADQEGEKEKGLEGIIFFKA